MQETSGWQTLLINVHIATMSENEQGYGVIENGAIAISDGKIVWLGEASKLPNYPQEQVDVIDGGGRWVTPGLIDCHTHLVFGGSRANEFEMRLNGASYEEIANAGGGIVSTVAATRQASKEELLAGAQQRLSALMSQGVSTVEIKSGYGLDIETELKMLAVAQTLADSNPVTIQKTFWEHMLCLKNIVAMPMAILI